MRQRAEEELAYDEVHDVKVFCLGDNDYPQRLKDCPDAPLTLFYKGTADLNARHIINIVGTRHCTRYGEDVIRHFVSDLHRLCPDVLIISGLAYGVDVQAHRNALAQGGKQPARAVVMDNKIVQAQNLRGLHDAPADFFDQFGLGRAAQRCPVWTCTSPPPCPRAAAFLPLPPLRCWSA